MPLAVIWPFFIRRGFKKLLRHSMAARALEGLCDLLVADDHGDPGRKFACLDRIDDRLQIGAKPRGQNAHAKFRLRHTVLRVRPFQSYRSGTPCPLAPPPTARQCRPDPEVPPTPSRLPC